MKKHELTLKDFYVLSTEEQVLIFEEIAKVARGFFNDGDSFALCVQKTKKATDYQYPVVRFCVKCDEVLINAFKARNHRICVARKATIMSQVQ
jgi:hypothetical protein